MGPVKFRPYHSAGADHLKWLSASCIAICQVHHRLLLPHVTIRCAGKGYFRPMVTDMCLDPGIVHETLAIVTRALGSTVSTQIHQCCCCI